MLVLFTPSVRTGKTFASGIFSKLIVRKVIDSLILSKHPAGHNVTCNSLTHLSTTKPTSEGGEGEERDEGEEKKEQE